ncbi:hypothetical protein Tco_0932910 [Tanacetum coccineum]
MSKPLKDTYRALETRYVHEGRTIDQSFYQDLADDFIAKFTNIGFDCILSLNEEICHRFIMEFYKTFQLDRDQTNNHLHIQFEINQHPFNISLEQFVMLTSLPNQGICLYYDAWVLDELEKALEQTPPYNSNILALEDIQNLIHRRITHKKRPKRQSSTILHDLTRLFKNLKANMVDHPFDERYILVPRKMPSLKAKQPKKPPPKRTRNVGKSKRAQLTTSSSSDSPPSDNKDLPSTKLSPRSYSRALLPRPNMSNEQRKTRGMFKNLARALHKFEKMLKKGCR